MINAIRDYEAISEETDPEKLDEAIMQMDELGAWDFDAKVKQILGKLNIHHLNQAVGTLSGGQRKRVALAKTLIDIGFEHKHVLLIMDEPTNHLDVEMVEWLEHYLNKEKMTLLLVTHDRYFLDAVCNEIWELDGQQSLSFIKAIMKITSRKKQPGWKVSRPVSIKPGTLTARNWNGCANNPVPAPPNQKAGRIIFTRWKPKQNNNWRISRLELQMKMSRLGGKVAELKKVYKNYGEKVILKGFDYTFKKGERVGMVGKNGAGKSTFINIFQGIEQPDSGKVNIGDTVIFGNYSQQGLQVKKICG